MTATDRPRVRSRDLRLTAGEERTLLVYDVRSDTGHVLNMTVAGVFQLADGTRTVAQMAERLPHLLKLPADIGLVELALHELATADLLEPEPAASPVLAAPEISRRSLLRRLALTAGAAASLVPVLESIGGLSQVAGASNARMGKSTSPHATREERLAAQGAHAAGYPGEPSSAPASSDPLGGSTAPDSAGDYYASGAPVGTRLGAPAAAQPAGPIEWLLGEDGVIDGLFESIFGDPGR